MLKKIGRVNCEERDKRGHREVRDTSPPCFPLFDCFRDLDREVDHNNRANQQHREFREHGQGRRESEPGRSLERSIEHISSQHEEEQEITESGRHVGLNNATMREHRRLKRKECDRKHRGQGAKQLARKSKDKQAQHHGERDHEHSRPVRQR